MAFSLLVSARCLCTGEKGTGKSGKPLHYKKDLLSIAASSRIS
jgi:hypothetical protein